MQKYKVYINKECKIITENWNKFCSDFQIIHAAGGLVYNPNDPVVYAYLEIMFGICPKERLIIKKIKNQQH